MVIKMMTTLPALSLTLLITASTLMNQSANASPFPEDLDSFLEILFEKAECEDFLSDDKWSTIALRGCKPFTCDFPRELCRRPAERYQDETSNTCVKIPDDCLVAANGGKPLITSPPTSSSGTTESSIAESKSASTGTLLPTLTKQLSTTAPLFSSTKGLTETTGEVGEDICNMDQPQGRFCGFQIKIAYNRENRRCEQFWFPGCKTEDTNQNLFDTVEQCEEATHFCRGTGSFVPFFITRRPATPVAVRTPTSPVPLVAPFLVTTLVPEPVTSQTTAPASVKSATAPIARPLRPPPRGHEISGEVVKPGAAIVDPHPPPPQPPPPPPQPPVQPRHLINPSSAGMILGLISNGISQFTGAGWGSGGDGAGGGGNFFSQIPQLIRSLQGG